MSKNNPEIQSDIKLSQIHADLLRPLAPADLRRIEEPPPCPESMSPEEYRSIASFSYF